MENFSLNAPSILTILISRKMKKLMQIYMEQKRLLIKEISQINIKKSVDYLTLEEKDDLYYLRRLYVSDYRQHLILTAFLMFYSYLEEALPQIHKIYSKQKWQHQTRKTGIEKYKDIFKIEYGINLSDYSNWVDLKDFSKIRHLILHANGNTAFAKDQDEIRLLLKKKRIFIYEKNNKIILREAVLQKFEVILDDFVRWVLNEINNKKNA